jgi:hypothetical protein
MSKKIIKKKETSNQAISFKKFFSTPPPTEYQNFSEKKFFSIINFIIKNNIFFLVLNKR